MTPADLADLLEMMVKLCPVCRGLCTVEDADWVTWRSNHPAGEAPPLGHGLRARPMDVPCPTCAGKGSRLTEIGSHVLSTLRPWL